MLMAAQVLCNGRSLAVVDGCNRFDVHAITRYARERHLNPDALLQKIFVSRGFTCYQMEAAVTNKLPAFLTQIHSKAGMIFGLLDTFYDEQAPLREVQHILLRVLLALQHMKEQNFSLLLVCTEWNVLPKERNMLFDKLKGAMDNVYHLTLHNEKLQLFFEQYKENIHSKGRLNYGTNSTDIHQYYRQ